MNIFRPPLVLTAALILAAVACATPFFPPEQTEVPSPEPIPTFTPAPPTTAPPTVLSNQPLSDSLSELLVALYQSVNPGIVNILTFSGDGVDVPTGQGSGFVIDMDGHIVTNQHVVTGATEIEVDFPSGLKAWATVIGTDPDSDLAVIKVEVPADQLVPLPLGDSSELQVGEQVVAIGNPFGLSGTMTIGIVSALGRTLDSERTAPGGGFFTAGDIIQTDAAINPGNSGGPLLNLRGEVIGVNRAIRTEAVPTAGTPVNSGIGFAVPIDIVRRVVPVLIEQGVYEYPFIGISSLPAEGWNLRTVEALGLPPDATGAYVTCVQPDGPAERAGVIGAAPCDSSGTIRAGGDLIVAIDGDPVREFSDLLSYLLNKTSPGQDVVLTIQRNGETVEVTVTLSPRP